MQKADATNARGLFLTLNEQGSQRDQMRVEPVFGELGPGNPRIMPENHPTVQRCLSFYLPLVKQYADGDITLEELKRTRKEALKTYRKPSIHEGVDTHRPDGSPATVGVAVAEACQSKKRRVTFDEDVIVHTDSECAPAPKSPPPKSRRRSPTPEVPELEVAAAAPCAAEAAKPILKKRPAASCPRPRPSAAPPAPHVSTSGASSSIATSATRSSSASAEQDVLGEQSPTHAGRQPPVRLGILT